MAEVRRAVTHLRIIARIFAGSYHGTQRREHIPAEGVRRLCIFRAIKPLSCSDQSSVVVQALGVASSKTIIYRAQVAQSALSAPLHAACW
jgi:hypothetical protein